VLEFTKYESEVEIFLDKLETQDGDDYCENLIGALLKGLQLKYRDDGFQCFLVLTDAPCHGRQYHFLSPNEDRMFLDVP
jgi:hypothetical protein